MGVIIEYLEVIGEGNKESRKAIIFDVWSLQSDGRFKIKLKYNSLFVVVIKDNLFRINCVGTIAHMQKNQHVHKSSCTFVRAGTSNIYALSE